jgi:hypothetical protein
MLLFRTSSRGKHSKSQDLEREHMSSKDAALQDFLKRLSILRARILRESTWPARMLLFRTSSRGKHSKS